MPVDDGFGDEVDQMAGDKGEGEPRLERKNRMKKKKKNPGILDSSPNPMDLVNDE